MNKQRGWRTVDGRAKNIRHWHHQQYMTAKKLLLYPWIYIKAANINQRWYDDNTVVGNNNLTQELYIFFTTDVILFHIAIRCIYPKGKKLWVTSCTRVLPQLCTFFSKLEAIVSRTLVKPRYYCQFIFLITSLLTYKRSFPLKIRLYKNKLPFISTGSSATEHKTEQSGTKHHQRSLDTAILAFYVDKWKGTSTWENVQKRFLILQSC